MDQQPKGLAWLEEVKRDAEFNYKKRIRDEREKRDYEASKAAQTPVTPAPARPKE